MGKTEAVVADEEVAVATADADMAEDESDRKNPRARTVAELALLPSTAGHPAQAAALVPSKTSVVRW